MTTPPPPARATTASIAAALARIAERVGAACAATGRDPATVGLVAATKTRTPGEVRALVAAATAPAPAGAPALRLAALGENRVQEAVAKQAELGDLAVPWHLIGALQTNKVRHLVDADGAERFALLHGVDRAELVDALVRRSIRTPLLIEVNVAGEATKAGCTPADAGALARFALDAGLDVRGFMTMAPRGAADGGRSVFAGLRAVRDAAEDACGRALPELSMGMTDDLDAAVAEGATLVRVGRALFGPRPAI